MATDPETTVRATLERAGVTADEEEIARLVSLVAATRELPSPRRTVEPHLTARAREWRR
jgi:MoxR-like ATPase